MGRPINRLSARQVAVAKEGYHADGGGLYLQVSPALTRSWVFRYQVKGKRREMGLGAASVVTLLEARQLALQQRRLLVQGIDPLDARKAAGAATAGRLWGSAKEDYIEAQAVAWRNEEQAGQWRQSLADYGPKDTLPMRSVTTETVLECLRPLWKMRDKGGKPETAGRLRGRIERIWDAERVAGNVSGENPARWKGHLEALLPPVAKLKQVKHHDAMPFMDVPAFMVELTKRKGLSRAALRFTILTAARTDEVVGMDWPELDLGAKLWTVPGHRMKAGREHVVPLTEAAIACLAGLPRKAPPFPLSEAAMLVLLQRPVPKGLGRPYTVHGFRSSFRDWAGETTPFPKDVVEMALAHTIKDKTEAAYRRGKLLAKRRELMDAWAEYLDV